MYFMRLNVLYTSKCNVPKQVASLQGTAPMLALMEASRALLLEDAGTTSHSLFLSLPYSFLS